MAKLCAALICLDCDEVFSDGDCAVKGQCPVCGSRAVCPLWRWVRPSDGIRRAAVVEPKAALLRDAALDLCRRRMPATGRGDSLPETR